LIKETKSTHFEIWGTKLDQSFVGRLISIFIES